LARAQNVAISFEPCVSGLRRSVRVERPSSADELGEHARELSHVGCAQVDLILAIVVSEAHDAVSFQRLDADVAQAPSILRFHFVPGDLGAAGRMRVSWRTSNRWSTPRMIVDRHSYSFSLDRGASPEDVAGTVGEYGVAAVHGFLDSSVVDELSRESLALFSDDSRWVMHEPYGRGRSVRVLREEIDQRRYPALATVFGSPYLEQVTAAYYGMGYLFATHVWVMEDVVGTTTVTQELHYDKLAHLKHFFYLSEVGPGNGPFRCVPGTQSFARAAQAARRARGEVPTDAEVRVLPDDLEGEIAVLGARGMLIVFDTDIAHRATVPTEGPRLAARSLSYGPNSIGKRLYDAEGDAP
jgi:hypothetical protein